MRKLVYLVLFIATVLASCEKDSEITDGLDPSAKDQAIENAQKVGDVNIKVSSPFEPIRLARARSTPNHAGRICACNECFGLCNRPHDGSAEGGIIGLEVLPNSEANLYFLNKLPSNFEAEFGVDEDFYFKNAAGDTLHTIATGLYNAVMQQGIAKDGSGQNYDYYATVRVNLK